MFCFCYWINVKILKKKKKKSKENIPGEAARPGLVRLKGTYNNNYQFEDLSQFVLPDQQIVKFNSIMKNSLSSSNIDERKEQNLNGACNSSTEPHRKYKHSKSVQLNNEDSIYGI